MSRLQGAGTLVPVWFFSPEGFTPVSLDEDPAARMERFSDFVDALYPQVPSGEKQDLVVGAERLMQGLIAKGAVYFASFMYAFEGGVVCSGMVTAFMMDGPPPGGFRFAEHVVEAVPARYTDEQVDVGTVTLPAGKAALITRDSMGESVTALLSPESPGEREVQRQLEAYLPFPDGSAYLQIVFGTSDVDFWPDLLPIIGGFLAGVSFSPYAPEPTTSRELRVAADDWARKEFG